LLALAAAVMLLAIWLLRWELRLQNGEPQDYDRHSLWLLLGMTGAAIVSLTFFATYLLWRAPGC
jgi:hypothetical protein